MGTMYNSFNHSKTIAMKMCDQHLIDITTFNALLELGTCMPPVEWKTVEWKKDEPVFSDIATIIAYCFGIGKYVIWRECKHRSTINQNMQCISS